MSYAAMRTIVRQKLSTGYSATDIAWDGFNLKPYAVQDGTPYIRPRIEDGQSNWAAIGGALRRKRVFSTLVIEIVEPAASGDGVGPARADTLIALFKGYSSAGLVFDAPGWTRDVGSEDGKTHRWLLFLPFYYEETA